MLRPLQRPQLRNGLRRRLCTLACCTLALCGPSLAGSEPLLHVPSPDWRDQVIYFLMTDRFNDGDPSNNDQGVGAYNPAHPDYYSGGDLQGIIDKLDYIQGLGASAIWITPPVANQWWDPMFNVSGYHGYWGIDFKAVDAHYGDLETYKALSDALHRRGMYLIQDIVPNHTGNFFTMQEDWDGKGEPKATLNTGSLPVQAPTQYPFNLNNPLDPEHREAGIYHWTTSISDYSDPKHLETHQLSELDDINTGNPLVRTTLKDSYCHWIREVGVDAFRIDTVIYVEHDFWHDFIHADDGVDACARETGRDDFWSFGEAWVASKAFENEADHRVASYTGTVDKPELSAPLNFPLHHTMLEVFGSGKPTEELTYRLAQFLDTRIYRDPYVVPTFIDNHDMNRFLTTGSHAALKQSLMFLLTAPGIPIIYYGTEQGFTEMRGAMFKDGYASGGKDHFDTASELYQYIAQLTAIRKDNPLFSRGTLMPLRDSASGPGIFAMRRDYEGETALVLFNTAETEILVDNLHTRLPAGTVLKSLYGIDATQDIEVGSDGKFTLVMAPREGLILKAERPQEPTVIAFDQSLSGQVLSEDFTLRGRVNPGISELKLVVDGELTKAKTVTVAEDGQWQHTVAIDQFPLGESVHQLTLLEPVSGTVSDSLRIISSLEISGTPVTVEDPLGDDHGLDGQYQKPRDKTFGGQMDIERVTAVASPSTLKLTLKMAEVTDIWMPSLGFDHLSINVWFDIPGNEGKIDFLPKVNGQAPEGFAWDHVALVHGWSSSIFNSKGASPGQFGTPTSPAAEVHVNKDAGEIELTFSAKAFGGPETLEGTRIYVTTWDFDGMAGDYRAISAEGDDWTFAGPDGARILDDAAILTIPHNP